MAWKEKNAVVASFKRKSKLHFDLQEWNSCVFPQFFKIMTLFPGKKQIQILYVYRKLL